MKNSKEIKEYYNEYSIRQKKTGVNQRHKSILSKLINFGLKPHHSVLEIGCGIGTQSGLILNQLSKSGKLNAYDLSDKSIEIAKSIYNKYSNATFTAADVTEIELTGEYDVIVLPDVIEHIPIEKHTILFSKLHKVLKPEGFMFIHIPFPFYQDWLHKNDPKLLQIIDQPIHLPELAAALFENDFFIKEMCSYTIYTKPYDYQYLLCLKKEVLNSFNHITKKTSLWEKIKYKLRIGN